VIIRGYNGCKLLANVARGGSIHSMLSAEDETRAVNEVSERLVASFPEVAPHVVKHTVHTSHEQFEGSPIRDFVPVLVERMAKSNLTTESPTH
jgi:hypothetical protein